MVTLCAIRYLYLSSLFILEFLKFLKKLVGIEDYSLLKTDFGRVQGAINNKIEYKVVKENINIIAITNVIKGSNTTYLTAGHYIKDDQCLGQAIDHANSLQRTLQRSDQT